jgi:CNT family concentrative nucleoside transporter
MRPIGSPLVVRLSRRAAAVAAVHGDGGGQRRRGTILAACANLLGERYLPYLLAGLHVGAGRHPDGEGDHRTIRDTDAVEDHKVEVAETFEEASSRPTSSRGGRAQTGVKLAVAVGAMVRRSSRWWRHNGLSAASAIGRRTRGPVVSDLLQRLVGYVFAPFMF